MSYRISLPTVNDSHDIYANATECNIHMDNGTILRIAIPCYYGYVEPHDQQWHDHIGWPSPGHPDTSCQSPYRDDRIVIEPIDFIDEGYEEAYVVFSDNQLRAITSIDENVINIAFNVSVNITTDSEYRFSIFIRGTDSDGNELANLVTKGTLYVSVNT